MEIVDLQLCIDDDYVPGFDWSEADIDSAVEAIRETHGEVA